MPQAKTAPRVPAPSARSQTTLFRKCLEVNAIRRIYGNGFFLLGVYVDPQVRKHLLQRSNRGMSEEEALKLMFRDESEGPDYGQRTRDTYHLSDFFVLLEDGDESKVKRTQAALERFLDIIFADPYRTPLFDEYAMFMAFAAATRSADLSRQIGAVIARDDEIIATGANDCPRSGGGTYWPHLDDNGQVVDFPDGRDYLRGEDRNDIEKARIINDAIKAMRDALEKNDKEAHAEEEWLILRRALESSTIDDITEFGRVVHAEMDALLACARNNISCQNAILYTTTFPCHNCAKHIIAAGIKRVVYVEPYPKSKALDFHNDSACLGFVTVNREENNKVIFEPFVGVGPRRFFDLFSMKQGSGYPIRRKNKTTGKTLQWEAKDGKMRVPELPWSYLEREEITTNIMKRYWKVMDHEQQRDDQPGRNTSDAIETDSAGNASSNEEGI